MFVSSSRPSRLLTIPLVALLPALAIVVVAISGPAAATPNAHAVLAERPGPTNVKTWGGKIADSAVAVKSLPSDASSIQAANWGGLALVANQVWQWNVKKAPKASLVSGLDDVVGIGEGFDYGAAVTNSGSVYTWGQNSATGDLCLGTTTQKKYAVTKVSGIFSAVAVSGGGDHLLILLKNGTVDACGSNLYGQLGDGTLTSSSAPVQVKGLDHIVEISAGSNSSMALDASGQVWSWGLNNSGQLGDGATSNSEVPVAVSLPGEVAQVYAGGWSSENGQTVVLLDDGTVYAWGDDQSGQLGNDQMEPYSDTPVQVRLASNVSVAFVATEGQSSFALDTSGKVWGWGYNSGGQLGDGRRSGNVLLPQQIASGYLQISSVAGVFVGTD
jgi:alpha-tubulin suppressor-like RCC1 family protein